MNIPFDTKLEFSMPREKPSASAIAEVNKLLQRMYKPDLALPDDLFGSKSRAKPSKQISKWLHDEHKIDASEYLLSQIGSLIERYGKPSGSYCFDFTHDLFWKSGDFGDGGSCFFSFNSRHRLMLQDAGGFAVRFYSEDGSRGLARAWMLPINDKSVALFNGYGYGTQVISEVVAAFLNTEAHTPDSKRIVQSEGGAANTVFYTDSIPRVIGEAIKQLVMVIPEIAQSKNCACGRVMHITDETCSYCKEGQNAHQ